MKLNLLRAGFLIAVLAIPVFAQNPASGQAARILGTIDSFNGQILLVKSQDGQTVSITIPPDLKVMANAKASLADIKPGDFVGRRALAERAQAAPRRRLVGLTSQSRRVPRHGYAVLWNEEPRGTVTSGAPSPTLGVPIAMAYVRPDTGTGTGTLAVDVRGKAEPATLVELPFYRRPA